MDSEGLTRLFDGPWALSIRGILWVGGWVVGRERKWGGVCVPVSPSATSDELKILSVCHTHVDSVPRAEETPQTSLPSSCPDAKHSQTLGKQLE